MPSTLAKVTPDWLTRTLIDAGTLLNGRVENLVFDEHSDPTARIPRLHVRYSDDASPVLPTRLLFKTNVGGSGQHEVEFYTAANEAGEAKSFLVRCLAARYDPETSRSYCLLEDVSESHGAPIRRDQLLAGTGVPTAAHLAQVADVLARFHAMGWEDRRMRDRDGLFAVRGWFRSRGHYGQHIEQQTEAWSRCRAAIGKSLDRSTIEMYDHVLPRLWNVWHCCLAPRLRSGRNLTLTHGDCNFGQFLCPRSRGETDTRLVGFDAAAVNVPAYDLAHLIPTFWSRSQRRDGDREQKLLRRYHATLQSMGVSKYSREQLADDYRAMVALMICEPVWDQTHGSPEASWRRKMQCLAEAFDDLGCGELFKT